VYNRAHAIQLRGLDSDRRDRDSRSRIIHLGRWLSQKRERYTQACATRMKCKKIKEEEEKDHRIFTRQVSLAKWIKRSIVAGDSVNHYDFHRGIQKSTIRLQ